MENPKYIYFDTETTGLTKDDEVIQIGAIITQDKQEDIIYNDLCDSKQPIHEKAQEVHGISKEDISGKSEFKNSDFYNKLKSITGMKNYLIAHNLNFDMEKINKEGHKWEKFKRIDTLKCAQHFWNIDSSLLNYKLQTLRDLLITKEEEVEETNKYNIEIKPHDAFSDVLVLKLFVYKMIQKAKEKYSRLKTDEDCMDEFVEITKSPLEIITFGKYKWHKIKDIEKEDSGYIDWLFSSQKKEKDNNGEWFNEKLYEALDKVRIDRNKNIKSPKEPFDENHEIDSYASHKEKNKYL